MSTDASTSAEETREILLPWLKERAKDSEVLGEPLLIMLMMETDEGDRPVFSDRWDPKKTSAAALVETLLHEAFEATSGRTRTRFTIALRGDSRVRRFVLVTAAEDDDEALVSGESREPTTRSPLIPNESVLDRVLWALFAAAAVSNTAQMVKPTTDDKPTMPKGTGGGRGGSPSVASRQYTSVAADTVAQYATRVANEMLKSYRERWKKR